MIIDKTTARILSDSDDIENHPNGIIVNDIDWKPGHINPATGQPQGFHDARLAGGVIDGEWQEHKDSDGHTIWEEAAPQDELDAIALEKARRELTAAADGYVNSVAREHRYKDIHAVGIYQGQGNPFKAEADALGLFAGEVWKYMEQLEQDVLSNARSIPTVEELMAELPKYMGP